MFCEWVSCGFFVALRSTQNDSRRPEVLNSYLFFEFLPANHIIEYHGKQDAHNQAILYEGAGKVWDGAEDGRWQTEQGQAE
jgi:hypothetical protein